MDMPVFRADKQSNHTRIGNYFIRDPDLSLQGKGMLCKMEFMIYEQQKGTFDLRTGIPHLENPST